jgi:hypothetical protein
MAVGMGTFYRSRHELVLVFKKGDAPHVNTFSAPQGRQWTAEAGRTLAAQGLGTFWGNT